MSEFTDFLNLELPDFNIATWHDAVNDNFTTIDSAIATLTGLNITGIWAHSTLYTVGDYAVDIENLAIYACLVNHTSASSGSFEEDRTANPTYWEVYVDFIQLAEDTATAKVAAEAAQAAAELAQAGAEAADTSAGLHDSSAAASATTALSAETNATGAATAAQEAQTDTETARDEAVDAAAFLKGVYLGAAAADPTVDLNGDALDAGDFYFNTSSNALKVYDGATWILYSGSSGITAVADDTSPELGGDLDLNGFDIIGTGDINITGNIAISGLDLIFADAGADALWGWDDSAGDYKNLSAADAFAIIKSQADAVYLVDATTLAKGISEFATAAEFRTGTDTTRSLVVDQLWSAAQSVTLTSSSNVTAVSLSAILTLADISLGENSTIAFSNAKEGQHFILWFTATTSTRTLTMDAAAKLGDGVEIGPYSITTSQSLFVCGFISNGGVIEITAIRRRAT